MKMCHHPAISWWGRVLGLQAEGRRCIPPGPRGSTGSYQSTRASQQVCWIQGARKNMLLLSSFFTCSPPVNRLFYLQSISTPSPSSWASTTAQQVKNLPATQETQETLVWSPGWENPLKKGMASHSSILAWRIPWTEEPGGLQSMGLQSQMQTQHTHTFKTYPAPAPSLPASAILHLDCVNSALSRLPAQLLSPRDPFFTHGKKSLGTPLMVSGLRLWAPSTGGPGSIFGQGARFRMPQQSVHILQFKIPGATAKTWSYQINKIYFF